MNKSTVLVLLFVLCVSLAATSSADIPSPLAQHNSGTPIHDIQCTEDKILMQSPSGRPVCVYEDTVMNLTDRGWTAVHVSGGIAEDLDSVTDTTTLVVHSTSSTSQSHTRVGSHGHIDATCLFQDEITLTLPRAVQVGQIFDVTATFSFDASKYEENLGMNAEEFWNNVCYKSMSVRHPPNYQASGDGLVQGMTYVNERYIPPIVYQGMKYPSIQYNQPPLTFQMVINELEDGVYDVGIQAFSNTSKNFDLNVLSEDDMYDVGKFHVRRAGSGVVATVYTHISDGIVHLSDTEFAAGQSDEGKPVLAEPDYIPPWNMPTVSPPDPSKISDHIPFDLMAELLEDDFKGEDPISFIKKFGLDDTYVREFLEEYPQFKTQSFTPVLNWILPQVLGQSK